MTILFSILYAAHANGTHHKLALRALEKLDGALTDHPSAAAAPEAVLDGERWRRLFLSRATRLLEGSKAPDKTFKDFANHVLHPGENGGADWGGAPGKTAEWRATLIEHLKAKRWGRGAYAAGVMSHYYTDPWMPFHTDSSDEETAMHRAVEWSVNKSFEALWAAGQADLGATGWAAPPDADAAEMTRAAARASHTQYRALIAGYDLELGSREPEAGLDTPTQAMIGRILAQAASGFTHLLAGALIEAGIAPPRVDLTVKTAVSALTIPQAWVLKKIEDTGTRAEVRAIYDELARTGTVERALPQELRAVREAREAAGERRFAETASEETTAAAPATRENENPRRAKLRDAAAAAPRPTEKPVRRSRSARLLARDASVEKGPSIGKKTAERLEPLGVLTVEDLLRCDPVEIAAGLDDSRMPADVVESWKDQARLMVEIPGLTAMQAVQLAAAGCVSLEDAAAADPVVLRELVVEAMEDPKVKRAARNGDPLELRVVAEIVSAAAQKRDAA